MTRTEAENKVRRAHRRLFGPFPPQPIVELAVGLNLLDAPLANPLADDEWQAVEIVLGKREPEPVLLGCK